MNFRLSLIHPLSLLFKRCKHAYINVARWWWLYILCILLDVARPVLVRYSINSYYMTILWFLSWALLGCVVLLAVRPSKRIKDFSYYWSYRYHFMVFCTYTALAWLIRAYVCSLSSAWVKIVVSLVTFLCVPYHTASTLYLSPFMIYLAFFLFDAPMSLSWSIKNIKNSFVLLCITYGYSVMLFCLGMGVFIGLRDWVLYPLVHAGAHIVSVPLHNDVLYVISEDLTKTIMITPFMLASIIYTMHVYKKVEKYFLS